MGKCFTVFIRSKPGRLIEPLTAPSDQLRKVKKKSNENWRKILFWNRFCDGQNYGNEFYSTRSVCDARNMLIKKFRTAFQSRSREWFDWILKIKGYRFFITLILKFKITKIELTKITRIARLWLLLREKYDFNSQYDTEINNKYINMSIK